MKREPTKKELPSNDIILRGYLINLNFSIPQMTVA